MATKTYNVVVNVSIDTDKMNRGKTTAKTQLSAIENDVINSQRRINNEVNRFDNTITKNTKSMGIWGQAFKGAFVGAIAGLTFSVLIGGITTLVSKTAELGITAVKMAGDFQTTTNALTLFAGSTKAAEQELSALADLALRQPGLTLDDAQRGATNLRALGFEAEITKNLVEGLAKAKLLSGTLDEGAVQRVIVNLQQLRAGSPQARRDIQQMILSLPSLSLEIQKTFGSVDKFTKAVNTNAPDALDKFAKAIAQAKSPMGGFNSELENVYDSFVLAGREFGKPFLEPVTEALKDLTKYLRENKSAWGEWGTYALDTLTGLKNYGKDIGSWADWIFGFSESMEYNRRFIEGFQEKTGIKLYSYGDAARDERLAKEQAKEQEKLNQEKNLVGMRIGFKDRTGKYTNIKIESVEHFRQLDEFYKKEQSLSGQYAIEKAQKEEANNAKELLRIETHSKEQEAKIKGKYAVQEALLNSHLRNTTADEIRYTQQLGELKTNQANEEYANKKKELQDLLKLNQGNVGDEKKYKSQLLELEEKHNAEIEVQKIETQNKIKELEQRARQERRQELIEFNNLQLQETKNNYDKQIFELERSIEQSAGLETDAFNQLIALSKQQTTIEIQNVRDNLALKLQDERLSKEQIINLKKQAFLEEQQLAEQNRRRILEIQENQYQNSVKFITQQSNKIKNFFESFTQSYDDFNKYFTSDSYSQSGFSKVIEEEISAITRQKETQLGVLKEIRSKLAESSAKQRVLEKDEGRLGELRNEGENYEKLTSRLNFAKQEVEVLDLKYAVLSKLNSLGITRKQSLELYQAEQLADAHAKQLVALTNEIDLKERLAKAASTYGKGYEAQVLLEEIKLLKDKKEQLFIVQALEDAAFKKSTRQGKRDTYQELLKGEQDKDIFEAVEGGLLQERNDITKQAIELRQIYNDTTLLGLYRQIEQQKVYNSLKQDELDAIIRIDKARIQIEQQGVYSKTQADAKLYEFFASQKGLTDIIGDAKVNTLTAAYSQLDNVIGRLTQKFGAFGDVVKDVLSSLIKLALNKVFMRLFGMDLNGNSVSGRNAINPIGQIASGIFGGGQSSNQSGGNIFSNILGIGGTAPFNPNTNQFAGASVLGLSGASGGLNISSLLHEQGHLLGAGTANVSGGLASLASGSLGAFGAALPLLGATLGAQLGGSSITGNILGALGGAAGGVAALGLTGGLTGLLGLGGALTATGIGIVAAPLLLLGAYFLGRNKQRRADEIKRTEIINDAFKQLDNLLNDVKSDKIDGASALSQADQIRQSYLDQVGQLKDKKTRNIAIKDVSRLDAKISELKAAATNQVERKARLEKLVPTFADGGMVSNFARKNNLFSGLVPGKYDRRDDKLIAVSGREVVLTPDQWQPITPYLRAKQVPGFANGGALNTVATANTSPQKIELHVSLNVGLSESDFVEVVGAYVASGEGGQEILDTLVTLNEKQGSNKLLQQIASLLAKK